VPKCQVCVAPLHVRLVAGSGVCTTNRGTSKLDNLFLTIDMYSYNLDACAASRALVPLPRLVHISPHVS